MAFARTRAMFRKKNAEADADDDLDATAGEAQKSFFRQTLSRLKHLNFILIHYMYILGIAFLGSLILLGMGSATDSEIKYVDLLFLSACAATQGGLATVDLNTTNLAQQILLSIISHMTNPIIINTVLVLVRIYWFNKRFKDLVALALANRGKKTKTFSRIVPWVTNKGTTKAETDIADFQVSQESGEDTAGEARLTSTLAKQLGLKGNTIRLFPKKKRPSGESAHPTIPEVDEPGTEVTERSTVPDVHERETEATKRPTTSSSDLTGEPSLLSEDEEEVERPGTGSLTATGGSEDGSVRSAASRNAPERDAPVRKISIMEPPKRVQYLEQVPPRVNSASELEAGEKTAKRKPFITIGQFEVPIPRFLAPKDWSKMPDVKYLDFTPTITGNSVFVGLDEEKRDQLGGIEYRSLKTLAWILMSYLVFFNLLGIVVFAPWINNTTEYKDVVLAANTNPIWWAIFTTGSSFNDVGFTLTPDSMISFQKSILTMLMGSFLIIAGNTGFPCLLRFTIWALSTIVPKSSGMYEELKFLLDHPRRCFTLLFPRGATWWLFFVLVMLNGLDTLLFVVLDLNNPSVANLNVGYKILVGLFQAVSTRTAGFSAMNVAEVHPAVQVSYMIMMYISIFPIAISIRRTNVYEERSLGLYSAPPEEDEPVVMTKYGGGGGFEDITRSVVRVNSRSSDDSGPSERFVDQLDIQSENPGFIGTHLRKQLSFDLWYLFFGLFILCISEGKKIEDKNHLSFTPFAILFELVSAYGTVGLSLGYPNFNTSFSGQFSTFGKIVIIAMLIRGRHRGLPYAVDRAVLLPGESLNRKDAQQSERLARGPVRRLLALDGAYSSSYSIAAGMSEPGEDATRRPSAATTTSDGRRIQFDSQPDLPGRTMTTPSMSGSVYVGSRERNKDSFLHKMKKTVTGFLSV